MLFKVSKINVLIHLFSIICILNIFPIAIQAAKIPAGGKSVLVDPLKQKHFNAINGPIQVLHNVSGKYDTVLLVESKVKKNSWNVGTSFRSSEPIKKGDVLLFSFWARTDYTADESGQSNVGVAFELNGLWDMPANRRKFLQPLTTSFKLATGDKWKQFFIRGKAPEDISKETFMVRITAGEERQRVWFADMQLLNYGPNVDVNSLPMSKYTYLGREPDAKWRRLARLRILKKRTRRVLLTINDKNGNPIKKSSIKVELKRHDFQFGVALLAWQLTPEFNPERYQEYRKFLVDNFSATSFINTLKWHPWAGDWGNKFNQNIAISTLKWVEKQKLPFRGHCMVWPRKTSVSNAMAKLLEAKNPNKDLIEKKILNHIEDIGSKTSFWMDEWDVLNESIPCHDIQDICGDQVMIDWFKKAREVLPRNVKLALNEYSILSVLSDTDKMSKHEKRIKYLLDGGAKVDVLGFQSHMGGAPPSPKQIYKVLNRFSKFKLGIRATEFDMKTDDKSLIYDFTRDFFTVLFSHSSVIGIQIWSIDNLFDKEGNLTPMGQAYKDLVLDKWKTLKKGRTDSNGNFSFRGFFGQYDVILKVNGKKYKRTFYLKKGLGKEKISIEL